MRGRFWVSAAVALAVLATNSSIALGQQSAYPVPIATPIIPADAGKLTVTSTTFPNGGKFPVANIGSSAIACNPQTPGAENVSPEISWTPGPPGTASYAVTMFDVDAPTGVGFWHWIVFNIPPTVTSLALNAAATGMPAGSIMGTNDGGRIGYRGPCPPVGAPAHRYYITVTALDKMYSGFGTEVGGARLAFLMSVASKVLARGQYSGAASR